MSSVYFDLAATAVIACTGAILILLTLKMRPPKDVSELIDRTTAVALFRDGKLVDATPRATDLLGDAGRTLDATLQALSNDFPTIEQVVTGKPPSCEMVSHHHDSQQIIAVSVVDDAIRLQFYGPIQLESADVALLRGLDAFSPQLIWQIDGAGTLSWSNAAFRSEAAKLGKTGTSLLMDGWEETDAKSIAARRIKVGDAPQRWFDVSRAALEKQTLFFATDATPLMQADKIRKDFVKTLGKTFADLSTGLAIFDKNRQLTIFNPALLDMTRLPVDFLSAMPKIEVVLDRLREMRMMPEPKNYATWREQFTAVEDGAKEGTYCENWSLPDGQMLRVTGRPHPDGAFALLFEDITAEISLTRRFRSDIETGQAVLDSLPDAIAVFSGAGTLVISNASYSNLWHPDASESLAQRELPTEIAAWQDCCIASPLWGQMHEFIQKLGTRKPWVNDAMLGDGRHLRCHAVPIAGGMTMVRFVIAPPMVPVIQKLEGTDHALR